MGLSPVAGDCLDPVLSSMFYHMSEAAGNADASPFFAFFIRRVLASASVQRVLQCIMYSFVRGYSVVSPDCFGFANPGFEYRRIICDLLLVFLFLSDQSGRPGQFH